MNAVGWSMRRSNSRANVSCEPAVGLTGWRPLLPCSPHTIAQRLGGATFSGYYYIQDRAGFGMRRLNELYAANGQIGFRGWQRTDGKLTLSAAVKHMIMA